MLLRFYNGLYFLGGPIVDPQFHQRPISNASHKFHEVDQKFLTHPDVSAF